MALSNFLRADKNSVTRARIYFHRLAFELQLAAGRTGPFGYALEVFEPEVDREGFDIVLNDGDYERHIQIKTILKSSTTAVWKIRTRLLRPTVEIADIFNLEPMSSGLGGGFLLQTVDDDDGCVIDCAYVDYFTLVALEKGLVGKRPSAARNVRNVLDRNNAPETVEIRRSVLLPVKHAWQVLGIMGLHNEESVSLVPSQIKDVVIPSPANPGAEAILSDMLSKLTN
jgi:hypothetical protein